MERHSAHKEPTSEDGVSHTVQSFGQWCDWKLQAVGAMGSMCLCGGFRIENQSSPVHSGPLL